MNHLKSFLRFSIFGVFAASLFIFTACDDDEGNGPDEQELITTVKLNFLEVAGGSSEFYVKDTDGDGGNPPVADTIVLKAGTAYTVGVDFLDESDSGNPLDLTHEIEAENTAHLVCFTSTGAAPTLTVGDSDDDGKPLGLLAALTTGAAGTGTLQVVLKHEPDKSAANPCSTGETDVEVAFPVKIQ